MTVLLLPYPDLAMTLHFLTSLSLCINTLVQVHISLVNSIDQLLINILAKLIYQDLKLKHDAILSYNVYCPIPLFILATLIFGPPKKMSISKCSNEIPLSCPATLTHWLCPYLGKLLYIEAQHSSMKSVANVNIMAFI